MGNFSEEQLEKDGFKYPLHISFCSHSGQSVKETLFVQQGGGEGTPRQSLLNALKIADGLGIYDIPVIEKEDDGKICYSLYFNSLLDRMKMDLAVNGIQYKKAGFVSIYRLHEEDTKPDRIIDTYVSAVKAFCDQRDIECQFREIDDRSFEILFDSNADQSAFFHARDKVISEMVRKLRSQPTKVPDFSAY